MARRASSSFAALTLACLAGCGSTPRSAAPGARVAGGDVPGGQVVAEAAAPVCQAPPRPPTSLGSDRGAAIDALLAGRYRDAAIGLEAVIRKHPRDLASLHLHYAAAAGLARAGAAARKSLRAPVAVAPIPLQYELHSSIAVGSTAPLPALRKLSEQRNLIVDDAEWLQKHRLEVPRSSPTAAQTPEQVPPAIDGERLSSVFSHRDHFIGVYLTKVGVFAPGKLPHLFDFTHITRLGAVDVGYAQVVGDALLVQLGRNGDTEDAQGRNGYIVAVSLDDGQILWSSGPRVASAANFAVIGASVVSGFGFGFSAQPDHLHVLDVATGRTRQAIPLRKAASWIIPKGDKLFVRTYDTDYEFALAGPATPPPVAELGPDVGDTARAADAEVPCWVEVAVAGMEARDVPRLRTAQDALDRRGADEPVVTAIAAAAQFLEQRQSPTWRGVDLMGGEETVVASPPWEYARNVPAAAPDQPPRLVRRVVPTPIAERQKRRDTQGTRAIPLPGRRRAGLAAPSEIDPPADYGFEPLRRAFRAGDGHLLVYGGRWVVRVDARGDAVRAFDLEQLRHPPRVDPQWKQFAVQEITGAAIVGDVLYIADGGGSYAREVFGKKGFMTALDARTGKLLWRSQPLVTGGIFVVYGDYLITGYGFTDEADYLYLLRRADGTVVQRASLPSAPTDIYLDASIVRVNAGGTHDFDLVP
jgi:outer membrane protein assembly factor BamB